jgi:hypothetical protein
MIIGYLRSGAEFMPVNEHYYVARGGNKDFSGEWQLTGAVRFNNFGRIVERKTAEELTGIKQRKYKNGKTKWYTTDIDHGTHRIHMSPYYEFIPVKKEVR